MADTTAGGRQVSGFHGLSFNYMKSPKFLVSDGGWDRIVWIPKAVKERIGTYIPENIRDKIPTEDEVTSLESLKTFLKDNNHPIVETWTEDLDEEEEITETMPMSMPMSPSSSALSPDAMGQLLSSGGLSFAPSSSGRSIKIVLENAKIVARKITFIRNDKKSSAKKTKPTS